MNPRDAAMVKLQAYCPYRGSPERSTLYLKHRLIEKVMTVDLIEAVEVIGALDLKGSSFPSLGKLLQVCNDAAARRKSAERANEDSFWAGGKGPMIKDMTPVTRAQVLAEFRRMRDALVTSFDMDTPGPTRWLHIDEAPEGWQSNRTFLYVGKSKDGRWSNPFVGNDATALYAGWFEESGLEANLGELVGKTLLCACRVPCCHAPFLVDRANALRSAEKAAQAGVPAEISVSLDSYSSLEDPPF